MDHINKGSRWLPAWLIAGLALTTLSVGGADQPPPHSDAATEYAAVVRPLLKKYCLECHSEKVKKGSLDLERFASLDDVRRAVKRWEQVNEMLEAEQMPPRTKPQPTDDERKQLMAWVHGFLSEEARAHAGDPGEVPLRRLSNAEYDCTIRDLTGVDLRPTREFPADGAAGEGFTNAAEALSAVSPALLTKYFNAAKDLSDHAVLLPDGFRFSPTKTRRDWTNESLAQLRAFFCDYSADGRLPLQPYLTATVRHRDALAGGKTTAAEVGRQEKLNPKYLGILWRTLTDKTPSQPLDLIRTRWRQAAEKDVPALAADIMAQEAALWQIVPVGSYRYGNTVRQAPGDPPAVDAQPLKIAVKPVPGQNEVVLYLVARDASPGDPKGGVIWSRPRLEGAGKPPLLLRDYPQFGPAFEADYAAVFADAGKYLAAAAEAANDAKQSTDARASKQGLDPILLKRWAEVLAVEPLAKEVADPEKMGKSIPAVPLELLDEKNPKNSARPSVNGWRRKGADLPTLIANSSDKVELIPGTAAPHKVVVHPTPTEFVAAVWKSPLTGVVRVAARVVHAHPACGNGVAWWLQHRRADRATVLAEGAFDLGGSASMPARTLKVEKDDLLVLAVDARNGDHGCDLTEITLNVAETEKPNRAWDLAGDAADTVLDGNPHADRYGHKEVWSFVRGPSQPVGPGKGGVIPANSLLGRWRVAAADPTRQSEAGKLAEQVQKLLTGARPPKEKDPDRILYDNLVSADGALLKGMELSRFARPRPKGTTYGIDKDRFGKAADDASLVAAANSVTEVRLPAALFAGREFVVEGKLDGPAGGRVVQFQALTAPPALDAPLDGKAPVVASPTGEAYKRLLQGRGQFRDCFPYYICFPRVIPDDEVVCLKMYHREDEPLARLFLDDAQKARIDRLWDEHRFISQQPLAENNYLPQFIGFVTQDQPKELIAYFQSQREPFRKRAEAFEKDMEAAEPKQLDALLDFASRAYRRPLRDKEKADLLGLYQVLRKKGAAHDEAFCGVLARVLAAPAFLFRIEQPPPGKEPGPVNDWELAARLSYFLWSSAPDDELRRLAAAGKLHDPEVLAGQVRRMLKDDRLRALAVEFGTQWLHVRGFDEMQDKNEKLFPTFDADLRKAINEESILFFQDLFQKRPTGDANSWTPTPPTSMKRWRSTTAFPAWSAHNGGAWKECESTGAAAFLAWRACRRRSRERRGPARRCAATGWWKRCWGKSCRGRRRTFRSCPKKRAAPITSPCARKSKNIRGRRSAPSAISESTRSVSRWSATTPSADCATKTLGVWPSIPGRS